MRLRFLALSLMFASQFCAAGELYKVVGPDGKISYTDRPPASASAQAQAVKVPGNSQSASSTEGDPGRASVKVLAMQGIVDTLTRFCARHVPQSSQSVQAARDAWFVRNAALAEQRTKVLRDLMTTAELSHLAERMNNENNAYLSKANEAPLAMKKTWCDDAPTNFAAREMDPSRDTGLVRTVMGYKFKKK